MLRKLIATAALTIAATLGATAVPQQAHATAQEPDRITLDGGKQIFMLNTNPLSAYLKQPGKFPLPGQPYRNTANWRGYIAKWDVSNGKLWLTDVAVQSIDKPAAFKEDGYPDNSALTTMFGRKGPILADWFTGMLTIPDGEMVQYVHMGYGSSYSHYRIFIVKKGLITAHYAVTPDEWAALRRTKFDVFKTTPEYRSLRDSLLKEFAGQPMAAGFDVDKFLFDFSADVYMAQ